MPLDARHPHPYKQRPLPTPRGSRRQHVQAHTHSAPVSPRPAVGLVASQQHVELGHHKQHTIKVPSATLQRRKYKHTPGRDISHDHDHASRPPSCVFPLHEWSAAGDIEKIKRYIDSGGCVNLIDPKGRTALHFAAAGGHVDILSLLISSGAEHSQDVNGNTPLHLAVTSTKLECVLVLLKSGAEVDRVDRFHRSAGDLVRSRLRMVMQGLQENNNGNTLALNPSLDLQCLKGPRRLIQELNQIIEILEIFASRQQIMNHQDINCISEKLRKLDVVDPKFEIQQPVNTDDIQDVVNDIQVLLGQLTV